MYFLLFHSYFFFSQKFCAWCHVEHPNGLHVVLNSATWYVVNSKFTLHYLIVWMESLCLSGKMG